MKLYLLCFLVFSAGYVLNMFYITVLYHRGLAHGAARLTSLGKWLAVKTGNWVTGIEPKAWVCMHRMHHEYSDGPQDPHSPVRFGVFGVILGQMKSYEKTLAGLRAHREKYMRFARDLDFEVNFLNRKRLWLLPYFAHLGIAIVLGSHFHSTLLGVAYWAGMMSHPIQGWLVNSFAHWYGYRNFNTSDESKNNLSIALLVFGEGLQNNHHHSPSSSRFSTKWWEPDPGYSLCLLARSVGLVDQLN